MVSVKFWCLYVKNKLAIWASLRRRVVVLGLALLFLFTLRNGLLADLQRGGGMCYAEKLLISRQDQLSPMHTHVIKAEDIIDYTTKDNVAERLAFEAVTGGGSALDAPMEASYEAFGLDPAETTDMEAYLKEYYDTILRRLREMETDLDKEAKKKLPF